MRVHYEAEFPISMISDSEEFQGRLEYNEDHIDNLSKKIGSLGQQLDPIILWHRNNEYIILAGFCRTRAIKKLGWSTIKANIYEDLTEQEALEISIVSNEDRYNLEPDEKAKSIIKLRDKGFSNEWIMEKYNLSKTVLYDLFSLENIDSATQYCLHREHISLRHAVELMRIKDLSARAELLKMIVLLGLSVRETKDYILRGKTNPSWNRMRLCPERFSKKTENCSKPILCNKCKYFNGFTIPTTEETTEDVNYYGKLVGYAPYSYALVRRYYKTTKIKVLCTFPIPKEVESLFNFDFIQSELINEIDINPDGTSVKDKEPMSQEEIDRLEKLTSACGWMYQKEEFGEWFINPILKDFFVNACRYSGMKLEKYKLKFKQEHPKEYAMLSHYDVAHADRNRMEMKGYKRDLRKLKKIPEVQEYIEANKAFAKFRKGGIKP